MHNFSTQKLIFPIALLIFSIYFLFSVWVADDAYITFRTVENFHQGYGLRWDIIERVQSYTHPLWMINLLIGKLLIGNIYYLSLLLSFIYSILTLYILYVTPFLLRSFSSVNFGTDTSYILIYHLKVNF